MTGQIKGQNKGHANLEAHKWRKGQTGNPGGRPKGLASRVRELTGDGEAVLDLLMDVLTGQMKANPREKLEAAKILLERGWGKAPELSVNVNANTTLSDIAGELADAHLETLARVLAPGSVGTDSAPPSYLPNPSDSLSNGDLGQGIRERMPPERASVDAEFYPANTMPGPDADAD